MQAGVERKIAEEPYPQGSKRQSRPRITHSFHMRNGALLFKEYKYSGSF
jgi:hypothetical protein